MLRSLRKNFFNQLNMECSHLRQCRNLLVLCYNHTYLRLCSIVPVKNGLAFLPLISLISVHPMESITHIHTHISAHLIWPVVV